MADVSVEAYPAGVRFDLGDGRLLDPPLVRASMLERRDRPLCFRALKDEVVAFEILVSGEAGVRAVRAEVEAPLRAEVYFAGGVAVRAPSRSDAVFGLGRGLYPDALIPTATVAVPAPPGVALVWIDVFVPRAAPAHLYQGRVEISGTASVPLEIEVLDRALPLRDVAHLGAANFGSLLALEKHAPERFLAWMQLLFAHHVTAEVMRMMPRIAESGAIDWAGWIERVRPFVEGTAFTERMGYVGPRAGQPISRFMAPLAEWWPVRPTGDRRLPSDRARWIAALGEMEAALLERGFLDGRTEWIIFINALDEPKSAEDLEALAVYGEMIRAGLSDRRHVTMRGDGVLGKRIEGWPDARKLEALSGAIDLWNLHGAPDTAPIVLLRRRGARAMFYASGSGGEPSIPPLVVDSPVAGARAWGWIVVRYGLEGAMNWEIDAPAGEGLNLDATLVYKGEEVGRAALEPIASMRLKMLRQGAEDAALWTLVQDADPQAAKALAKRMVPHALGDGVPRHGTGAWPRDVMAYERARAEMIDRLAGERPLGRGAGGIGWAVGIAFAAAFVIARWISPSRTRPPSSSRA